MFKDWLTTRYTDMASEYRLALSNKVEQFRAVTSQFPVRSEHVSIGIEALAEIPIPPLGKYPGEANAEDRAWFASAVKPDYACMLAEATDTIHKLRVAVTDASSI